MARRASKPEAVPPTAAQIADTLQSLHGAYLVAASQGRPATTEEVAAFLRKSKHAVECWRSQGKGPRWRKIGRSVVYDWPAVYEWYESQPESQPGGKGHAA